MKTTGDLRPKTNDGANNIPALSTTRFQLLAAAAAALLIHVLFNPLELK
jgi:hypothetical protein